VQGTDAPASIISALERLYNLNTADVIIVGRGGGSIEDLWAFNDEALARVIYNSPIPIISAVGHETDFTICDFVADLRAPTPSAAAEIAVPDSKELMMRIDSYEERLTLSLKRSVEVLRNKLADREKFIKSTAPLSYLEGKRNTLALYTEKSVNAVSYKLTQLRSSLAVNAKKADALSPLSVISRGYSLAESDGCVVRSIKQVENGDLLRVRVSDGVIESVVTNCNEKEYKDGEN
jgi:exodeoxyribonuclease VII large subunit